MERSVFEHFSEGPNLKDVMKQPEVHCSVRQYLSPEKMFHSKLKMCVCVCVLMGVSFFF